MTKRALTAAMTAGVLLICLPAFAGEKEEGHGARGCCYGPGMHMWGGPGMHMQGYGAWNKESRKFLDETVDLRKDMHAKMFDYREAWRRGDEEKAKALEKELDELGKKLDEKAGDMGLRRGYPGRGYGPGMMWY